MSHIPISILVITIFFSQTSYSKSHRRWIEYSHLPYTRLYMVRWDRMNRPDNIRWSLCKYPDSLPCGNKFLVYISCVVVGRASLAHNANHELSLRETKGTISRQQRMQVPSWGPTNGQEIWAKIQVYHPEFMRTSAYTNNKLRWT